MKSKEIKNVPQAIRKGELTNVLLIGYNRPNFKTMSKEALRDVLEGAKKDLVKAIHNVADATENALNNGDASSVIIPAALNMIAKLAVAGNEIFSRELPVPTDEKTVVKKVVRGKTKQRIIKQIDPEKPKPKNKDGQNPTTFEELLEARISNELFGQDKEEISKEQLLDLLIRGEKHGAYVRKLPAIQNLDPNEKEFRREKAIEIIKVVLISHQDKRGTPRETYTRTELMYVFRATAPQLNVWGEKIGYDWKENPILDRKTALAIKGLFALDKLLGLTKPRKPLQKTQ